MIRSRSHRTCSLSDTQDQLPQIQTFSPSLISSNIPSFKVSEAGSGIEQELQAEAMGEQGQHMSLSNVSGNAE